MKKLYIIKAGTTFPDTKKKYGDFDAWISSMLGPVALEVTTINLENGETLPAAEECAGVIISGSHAMVTENLPFSVALERWLPSLLDISTPVLGICYGHQLLAQAAGGTVSFHPSGKEIGTVAINLLDACTSDALFRQLPITFPGHVTHGQTVVQLPPNAVLLAKNTYEPHHAFRLGDAAWGVQFHPEFTADIMRSYIEEQKEELKLAGHQLETLMEKVAETPVASQVIRNFANLVESREAASNNRD